MQRAKNEMDETGNSKVYRVSRKHYLANKGSVRCTFCKYHRNENVDRSNAGKSWKSNRKKKYRVKK